MKFIPQKQKRKNKNGNGRHQLRQQEEVLRQTDKTSRDMWPRKTRADVSEGSGSKKHLGHEGQVFPDGVSPSMWDLRTTEINTGS